MPSFIDRSPIIVRDPGLVGASLDRLADQLRDGWRQAKRVRLPVAYRSVTNIALCGLGGSTMGGDILRSALSRQLKVPVTIVDDYMLPGWVDKKTLVICSSYSGSTEETISTLCQAIKRRLKVVVMTNGGTLAALATQHRLPLYQYHDTENPSKQPRLGVAYSTMAMLACLRKLGLVSLSETDVQRLPVIAWEATKRCGARKPHASNPAKKLALELVNKIPLLIGSEWSAANVRILHNQINENSKTFVSWYIIPALNHHLLEGLRNRTVTKQMRALLILDENYNKRNQRRLVLTTKILKQLGAKVSSYTPRGTTPLEKAIDFLAFGGYVSWYLAAVRHVKPADIPTVNYLKAQLAKR